MDMIMSGQTLSGDMFSGNNECRNQLPQLRFRHEGVFNSALQFDLLAKKLVEKAKGVSARSCSSSEGQTAVAAADHVVDLASARATVAATSDVPVPSQVTVAVNQ
jgi:hypothetical protein